MAIKPKTWVKFLIDGNYEIGRVAEVAVIRTPRRTENGDMIRVKDEKGNPTSDGAFVHDEKTVLRVVRLVENSTEIIQLDEKDCEIVLN